MEPMGTHVEDLSHLNPGPSLLPGSERSALRSSRGRQDSLVAEWIHFTLFGIILPTIKLKVYTLGGL